MIQAVVFDLDGTLVDSFEDIARAANHALTELGRPPRPLAEVKSHVGHGLRNLLRCLLPGSSEEEIDRAMGLVKEYYLEHPTDFTRLYPGAMETLERLSERGIRTAVLSNKVDSLTRTIGKNLGFAEKMDAVWGHRADYPLKPDPQSLLAILSEFGTPPENCLVVGDASPDRLLAKTAGARFVGVTFGMTDRKGWEEQGVDEIVDSLLELPDLIVSMAPVGND